MPYRDAVWIKQNNEYKVFSTRHVPFNKNYCGAHGGMVITV